MTYDEYLVFERASDTKHEFVDGHIYGMSGGTFEHALIAGRVIGLLFAALAGAPCAVLTSDMRIRTGDGVGTYPDVSIVCGERRFTSDTQDELLNPGVVIEVLSPSTEAYDRGDKFEHYQTIESLAQYVLVAHRERAIEVWTRADDGWQCARAVEGDVAVLAAVDARLDVREVYEAGVAPIA